MNFLTNKLMRPTLIPCVKPNLGIPKNTLEIQERNHSISFHFQLPRNKANMASCTFNGVSTLNVSNSEISSLINMVGLSPFWIMLPILANILGALIAPHSVKNFLADQNFEPNREQFISKIANRHRYFHSSI